MAPRRPDPKGAWGLRARHARVLGRASRACPLGARLLALACLALVATAASADRVRPRVAAVPFRNVTGQPQAQGRVMDNLHYALTRAGMQVVGNGRIETWLRRHRIRARDALSRPRVSEVAELVGARYVLVGTIDSWSMNGGPEVGLTARLIDARSGQVVWTRSEGIHALDEPGLIAATRPQTLDGAVDQVVARMVRSIRLRRDGSIVRERPPHHSAANVLAAKPIVYSNPKFEVDEVRRIAVLPLENRTNDPNASVVVGDHLNTRLLGETRLAVVEPGELRRALIENDIQPLYGVTAPQLTRLREFLGIDAVLDGTILTYENGHSRSPRLDVYMRLRDARNGAVLWEATTQRDGEKTKIAWNIGLVRSMDRLARATVNELINTWIP